MPDGERDDPLRLHSPTLFRFFANYLRQYARLRFRAIRVSRDGAPPPPPGRPAIVFTNHPSWWDPALFILLMDTLMPGRAGFGPMEAEAFAKNQILRRMGVFGIDTARPRGAARFLDVSQRVLRVPGNVLWVTAEGAFTDVRTRPVVLRPGLAHLARRAEGAVLVPMALEYTFWNESRPEALLRFGAPIEAARAWDVPAWTASLTQALAATMDALAADGMSRDPARFTTLREAAGRGFVRPDHTVSGNDP